MPDAHALILDRLMAFPRPHFLAAEDLYPPDIIGLLDLADAFVSAGDRSPLPDLLKGLRLICAGDERAQAYLEAGRVLGAEALSVAHNDLATTDADLIVLSHPLSGAARHFAAQSPRPLINAGDGNNQAPVQALGDLLTLRRSFDRIDGLNVALLGDITHSPGARSNAILLSHMGAHIRLIGPATLIPGDAESWGCDIYHDLPDGLKGVDALLIQPVHEARLHEHLIPSWREYARFFGLDHARLKLANPGVRVLHTGPVRQGVELAAELLDDSILSLIAAQARAHKAARLAVLASFAQKLGDAR